jgi:hypothetical protein
MLPLSLLLQLIHINMFIVPGAVCVKVSFLLPNMLSKEEQIFALELAAVKM